jgi:hypothetical protein
VWARTAFESIGSSPTADGNYDDNGVTFVAPVEYPSLQLGGANIERRFGVLNGLPIGDNPVAGLGFLGNGKPDVIFFSTAVDYGYGDNGVTNNALHAFGVAGKDSSGNLSQWGWSMNKGWYYVPNNTAWSEDCVLPWFGSGAEVLSLDSDGFTLRSDMVWPGLIGWVALKLHGGGNRVEVGAYSRSLSTGWQNISLGLDPSAVWIVTGERTTHARTNAEPHALGTGYADVLGNRGWSHGMTVAGDQRSTGQNLSKGPMPQRVDSGGNWDYGFTYPGSSMIQTYWYTAAPAAWRHGYVAFQADESWDGSPPMFSHMTRCAHDAVTIPNPYTSYGYWNGTGHTANTGLAISPSEKFVAGCFYGGNDSIVTTSVHDAAIQFAGETFPGHNATLIRTPPAEIITDTFVPGIIRRPS